MCIKPLQRTYDKQSQGTHQSFKLVSSKLPPIHPSVRQYHQSRALALASLILPNVGTAIGKHVEPCTGLGISFIGTKVRVSVRESNLGGSARSQTSGIEVTCSAQVTIIVQLGGGSLLYLLFKPRETQNDLGMHMFDWLPGLLG